MLNQKDEMKNLKEHKYILLMKKGGLVRKTNYYNKVLGECIVHA